MKAQKIYSKLRPFFKKKEDEYFNDVLTSVILLLLHYDRKLTIDSFKQIQLYFDLIDDPHETKRTKPELLLSYYGIKTNKAQSVLSKRATQVEVGPTGGQDAAAETSWLATRTVLSSRFRDLDPDVAAAHGLGMAATQRCGSARRSV